MRLVAVALVSGSLAGCMLAAPPAATTDQPSALPASSAHGLPDAGTVWSYQLRDLLYAGRAFQFSIRILRVEEHVLEEELTSDHHLAPTTSWANAYRRSFIQREMGGHFSVVEPPPYLFAMEAGGALAGASPIAGYPLVLGMPAWRIEMRVAGWEDVVVPAGRYRARRVEFHGRGQWTYFGHSHQPAGFRVRAWYAPAVRRYVRVEHDSWTTGPNVMPLIREVVELVSHRHL